MNTITLTEFIDNSQELDHDKTVVIASLEATKQIRANMLLKHAKTMMMMYEQIGDIRYVRQAKIDINRARLIIRN